jgi:predicted dienelactone hydrolase
MVMRFILSLILADALMDSQGFVVVGIRESSGGSELMSAAIDWLEEQNADAGSPMYDKLILNRVGVFGHSIGGAVF